MKGITRLVPVLEMGTYLFDWTVKSKVNKICFVWGGSKPDVHFP